MRPESVRAVLLDMDGTLVDAFGPIVTALNRTLADFGLPAMSEADIRRHTGRGECSMISLFGDRREEAAERFLGYHDERLLDVRPLPGAETMLDWLAAHGMPAAIVTSKHQDRAERQLAHLGWRERLASAITNASRSPATAGCVWSRWSARPSPSRPARCRSPTAW